MLKKTFISAIILLAGAYSAVSQYAIHSEFEAKTLNDYLSGKQVETFYLQLMANEDVSLEEAQGYYQEFDNQLKHANEKMSKMKSKEKFLSWFFYTVHHKYLKHYQEFSSLANIFNNGYYDCLSATTLYALWLNSLGFETEIIETNYHVYLLIESDGRKYLVESTDGIYGFVSNEAEIATRLKAYNADYRLTGQRINYEYQLTFNKEVSLSKLAGLQYYNEAIAEYNARNYTKALDLLEKATLFYHSERITEVGILLAQALSSDADLDIDTKKKAIGRIGRFIKTDNAFSAR